MRFETVREGELWRYCDANPNVYRGTEQVVPNSGVSEEHWYEVIAYHEKEAMARDQFDQLSAWADDDAEFVRRPVLETARWEQVT